VCVRMCVHEYLCALCVARSTPSHALSTVNQVCNTKEEEIRKVLAVAHIMK
jgi:hypothetical protein